MSRDVIRVLIVDDSALYRQLVQNVLRELPDVDVVGVARTGQEALERVADLNPDVITLDVHMPVTDGIEVLRTLKRQRSRVRAIMLSGLTAEGAQVTTDALLEGAFDFILKPSGPDPAANRQSLFFELSQKLQLFRDSLAGQSGSRPAATAARGRTRDAALQFEAIVIGTSTGGPLALRQVLPNLPGDLPVPILIVQHMPAQYTHSLARRLNECSQLEVVEGCDGMSLEPGWAYLAPGGRQMKVIEQARRRLIRITDDPPENSCRPSVDYLLRSVVDVMGSKVMAVVMTGMGRDGLSGCREVKQRGGFVIAQHPDGCTVYGMPKAVVQEGLADEVVPIEEIPRSLASCFANRRKLSP